MTHRFDVAIIGAGFSGSILAWILASRGRSVVLIDSQTHPRFAIGESSTPIADRLLARLGMQYGLPDLVSLATYGNWKTRHPELGVGRKRGFSYYVHEPNQSFTESDAHDRSLLVAASAGDAVADTHWYRPDVDQYLFRKAVAAGAEDCSGCSVELHEPRADYRLRIEATGSARPRQIESDWVVDASGQSSVLARLAGSKSLRSDLRTNTSASFAHFDRVASWHDQLQDLGLNVADDPFDADAAAQHHLLQSGWMWMLRFDNGLTSVGITNSPTCQPLNWSRYPSLAALFREASIVAPVPGVATSTGRLQRFYDPVVDARSLMLPTAAVTIDPLYSTGITHALAGVQRVAEIIIDGNERNTKALTDCYRETVMAEARLLDRLVDAAYCTMNDFPRFVAACMLYFAGAIACEERMQKGEQPSRLWGGDDERFVEMAYRSCDTLCGSSPTDRVVSELRAAISPWNTAGLMDPAVKNRYAYTATK